MLFTDCALRPPSQRVVAHRTGSSEECFLERLQEDFFEHESRLEAIRDQVVTGPAETLYTWNVNLTDHQVRRVERVLLELNQRPQVRRVERPLHRPPGETRGTSASLTSG